MKVLATAELESGWFYGRVVDFEKYQLAVNNAAEKERARAEKQEKLTNWYTLYSQVGWKEFVKCTGCTLSQDNLTKQFSRYCDDFKPQSGRKRGL